jgi:glycosyltransferase involved in cell wall biosynthesis
VKTLPFLPQYSLGSPRTGHPRPKIAFVSTSPPRRCGIATFTDDLLDGLAEAAPDLETVVCAVDRDGLEYGPKITHVLEQDDPAAYPKAAAALAEAGVDAVVVQHEFGIFGGPDGMWINDFAEELTARGVPYLVTLHTVLSAPTPGQAAALERLCRGAAGVTAFTPTARHLAAATGIAPAGRLAIVPHGAPAVVRAAGAARGTDVFRPEGIRPEVAEVLAGPGPIVSTFGLVSSGKGLETAISAAAELAAEHPGLRYVIAGATHPEAPREHGVDYRAGLGRLARELGAADNVRFLDFFLTEAEIAALLHRSEVFLTPYRSREQISSGALTFALAAGCPVVSTAYHYARDMLADGAGTVVEPGDTDAFTEALRILLTDPGRLAAATVAARAAGRDLGWSAVAARFADLVRATVEESAGLRRAGSAARRATPAAGTRSLPGAPAWRGGYAPVGM